MILIRDQKAHFNFSLKLAEQKLGRLPVASNIALKCYTRSVFLNITIIIIHGIYDRKYVKYIFELWTEVYLWF